MSFSSHSPWQSLNVSVHQIRSLVLDVPELAHWPELSHLFPEADSEQVARIDWLLPAIAAEAVGSAAENTLPAVAAMACLQVSIILVDDILDEEPDGTYQKMGVGRTANLALALQGAAQVLVHQCQVDFAHRAVASLTLNQMALDTAVGQEYDVQNITDEAGYWHVVETKSTPFYLAGMKAGAELGGADAKTIQALAAFGAKLGETIQIMDDLEDAFKSPANPDWMHGRNNLPILYGVTAEYPQKETFMRLRRQIDQPENLHQAQQILIQSGAVSYAIYQILERHRQMQHWIQTLSLANPELLENVRAAQLYPIREMLRSLSPKLADQLQAYM